MARPRAEIGVSGNSSEPLGAPRTTPYPMPAIPQTYLDKAYAEGPRRHGL